MMQSVLCGSDSLQNFLEILLDLCVCEMDDVVPR